LGEERKADGGLLSAEIENENESGFRGIRRGN